MARGPAVVVIARHGARLDAADKTWHLTSPTPYDPPLTYGGWSQGKALGLRIASLLHARDTEAESGAKNGATAAASPRQTPLDGLPRPTRRKKIVVHSSPYLRCVQTSTAIAAGIAQFQAPATAASTSTDKVRHAPKHRNGLLGRSSALRSASTRSASVQPVSVFDSATDPNLEIVTKPHVGPDKLLLRIDAFLGEWLSPDYFEDITPPPNSTMMVAGAKADLLRRGDYIEAQPNLPSSKGHFPGGWVKGDTPSPVNGRKPAAGSALPPKGSLAQVSAFGRDRASSQGASTSQGPKGLNEITTAHKAPDHVYDPPVPSYSVSPSDPIPRGYVSHARDACIDVDFQWDSMRAPQEWGDGGEYGDEWSTMHKRFRKGLAGMMSWYKANGVMPPKDKFPGFTFRKHAPAMVHHASDPFPSTVSAVGDDGDDEDEEDLVLILVTHGAGCNALLGAISNQPVLLDVGLASLSMAIRREEPRKPSETENNNQRRSSVVDMGMADSYDMKMIASVDHLRPGVDPTRPPPAHSPAHHRSSPSLEYRRRFAKPSDASSPTDSIFSVNESFKGLNSSLGSMRRSSASGSSSRLLSGNPTSPTTGLWGSNLRSVSQDTSLIHDGSRSPGYDMVLNFHDHDHRHQHPKLSAFSGSAAGSSSSIPGTDGANEAGTAAAASNGHGHGHHLHDKKEESDNVAPLPVRLGGSASASQTPRGGLWVPKLHTAPLGLWGPPPLDDNDLCEHPKGAKRRWTVTERE
ncbi:hypothetical protein BDV95DRAFT_503943 [Massariosphaeria phaeospora]|uniref:Histidine phosphatase superfamily n=1 Tax=Massariosphaeria phaeospora TaxID=100035 RepID=A0A7C8I7B2_9PLEO|nr:hypothetical protein BDV95DRAFT_503943 [Massariosphaeria phaeospora]